MEEKVWKAALAGLLHDVGKLEQRARIDPWKPAEGYEDIGPPVHATWSASFIQVNVPEAYRAAALAGAYHHAPDRSPGVDKSLSKLVALADKLSAGERDDPEEKEKKPPQQMITVFDRISLGGEGKKEGWHYLPLTPLSLKKEALFPTAAMDHSLAGDCYDVLCQSMRSDASRDIADPAIYLENMMGALEKYTWCVPSAYYHSSPDVSLYDHCRMTAALAVCLSDNDPAQVENLLRAVIRDFQDKATPEDKQLLDKPVSLLVGGDISGIQDFIYTITAKGAARTLRGRSFYLQLLTEAVLRFVLRELGLPYVNVIYSGGGHFFLLAPVSAEDRLQEIRRKVTEKLLRHHGSSLYLAIGCSEVPASGFKVGNFPDHWGRMHADLGRVKQRRYTELGVDLHALIFQVPQEGGNPDENCSVCGEDHRKTHVWDIEREEQARICSLCDSFIEEIGKPLPGAKFIVLGWGLPRETAPGKASDALAEFGLQVRFMEKAETIKLDDVDQVTIWALDDPFDENWPDAGKIPAARILRYSVNQIPQKEKGQPVTFDELQEEVRGGFKRLGVLRMDVDNLGDIFKSGLGEYATLARLSTLSFQVSLFFEGWVKRICEVKEYGNLIYAVYAGGDDVFLLGPWDIIPGLAKHICRDFASFTAEHPAIHLSAGMAFIDGKYPVYQAAEDAAEALATAKDRDGKNAFSFLGGAWKWDVFDRVDRKKSRIRKLVTGKDDEGLAGPQAIIQVLRGLAKQEAEKSRLAQARPVWGVWMWRGAYQLKRMAERYEKTQPELAKAILAIRDELDEENYQGINQWGTAARWTQLETRKGFRAKESEK